MEQAQIWEHLIWRLKLFYTSLCCCCQGLIGVHDVVDPGDLGVPLDSKDATTALVEQKLNSCLDGCCYLLLKG